MANRRDTPALSRGERSSLFGKRTRDKRTKVSDFTDEKLQELWRSLGYSTEAQFLAELIEIRVHGVAHVEKLQGDRLRAVAGLGTERG